MIVKPIIFDNILFGELAPWLPENSSETKFRDILNNQVRANKDNPEKFFKALLGSLKEYSVTLKIDHLPNKERIANLAKFADLQSDYDELVITDFFSKASEFYFYLINNECIRIRTAIATNVLKCKTPIDSEFHVVSLLNNLAYTIEQLGQKKYNDKLSIYVHNALKISLFRLYTEIKNVYPAFIGNEALTENEIINFIFKDFDAEKSIQDNPAYAITQYLSSKKKKSLAPISVKDDKISEKPVFIPNKSDFRSGYKGKLSYEDIVNPELFSKLEEDLYLSDFIDNDYNFTNKHNKKKELAAIYKILISKKYFREKNYKHQSKFRAADYRQYLDHRYNVDTSQQFRKCSLDIVKTVSESYIWLDNLPACR